MNSRKSGEVADSVVGGPSPAPAITEAVRPLGLPGSGCGRDPGPGAENGWFSTWQRGLAPGSGQRGGHLRVRGGSRGQPLGNPVLV